MQFIIFIILISIFQNNVAQRKVEFKKLKSNFSLKGNKENYYKNLINNSYDIFRGEITTKNEKNWLKAIQDLESIFLSNEITENALIKILNQNTDKFINLQRTGLQAVLSLFPNKFNVEIERIFNGTNDLISFAICANYYLKNNINFELIQELLEIKFHDKKNDPLYISLLYDIQNQSNKKFLNRPELSELLNHPFQKGKTIIYSFHRKDRRFTGITIIKKPDGGFVTNSDGTIFYIKQLALSFSNLPGYIPNGNTPEGIYSIVGWYISPNQTIGPTPNILLRSPFEVSPNTFFHNAVNNNKWLIEDYKNLLPDSWKNYFPIYQSFYSGNIGRKLIIMHGSADELNYYKELPFYPLSPTRGCLSSTEIWNENTGSCIQSDQAKLINAFFSTEQTKGFLIVVELDNKKGNVTISELMPFLMKNNH